jgi:hypothetical protein
MSQESQAQFGDGQKAQQLVYDEIDEIYRKQPNNSTFTQFRPEQVINPDTKKLYAIADDITQARMNRLNNQFLTYAEHQRNFVGSVAKLIFNRAISLKRPEPLTEAMLRARESEVGATIFGETAPNERREFFYERRIADRDSWFFYQAITDSTGPKDVTMHYEVHPTGVLKLSSHPGTQNAFIKGQEHNNFMTATGEYHDRVMNLVYSDDPKSSEKAA